MKVLVVKSQVRNAKSEVVFDSGIEHLRKQGHNLKRDSDLTKGLKFPKDLNKYQLKIEKFIREVDIVITDVSNADAKVGYEVSKALADKKIVICLETEGSKNFFPGIHGNKQKGLIIKQYNKKNINDVIDDAINEAKTKLDTKFILIISPEIDKYLDWASQTKRMHKAQLVRNAVEKEISKDKEFKTFLRG